MALRARKVSGAFEKRAPDHQQKRGGRELGGVGGGGGRTGGRGCRRKTRKLSLKILVKDADGFITSFRFLSDYSVL